MEGGGETGGGGGASSGGRVDVPGGVRAFLPLPFIRCCCPLPIVCFPFHRFAHRLLVVFHFPFLCYFILPLLSLAPAPNLRPSSGANSPCSSFFPLSFPCSFPLSTLSCPFAWSLACLLAWPIGPLFVRSLGRSVASRVK